MPGQSLLTTTSTTNIETINNTKLISVCFLLEKFPKGLHEKMAFLYMMHVGSPDGKVAPLFLKINVMYPPQQTQKGC